MTIEQIYELAGGNLENVLRRIPGKAFLMRMLCKFVEDPSKAALDQSIVDKDPQAAFRAVHTMKGVCLSLGLDDLSDPCKALTEDLRPGSFGDGWEGHYQQLCKEYGKVIQAIKELEA